MLDFYFLSGPSPADVARQYAGVVGTVDQRIDRIERKLTQLNKFIYNLFRRNAYMKNSIL